MFFLEDDKVCKSGVRERWKEFFGLEESNFIVESVIFFVLLLIIVMEVIFVVLILIVWGLLWFGENGCDIKIFLLVFCDGF